MIKNENRPRGRQLTYRIVYEVALEVFKQDKDKTNIWWMTQIKDFENRTPFEIVRSGDGRKLIKTMMRYKQ